MIISYYGDMEEKFEKPIFKNLGFHRKSRIIERLLDLPVRNIICEHDVIFWHVVHHDITAHNDSTAQ